MNEYGGSRVTLAPACENSAIRRGPSRSSATRTSLGDLLANSVSTLSSASPPSTSVAKNSPVDMSAKAIPNELPPDATDIR